MLKNYRFDVVEGRNKTVQNQVNQFVDELLSPQKDPAYKAQTWHAWNEKIKAANKYLPPTEQIKEIRYSVVNGNPVFDVNFTKDDLAKAAYVAYRFNESQSTEYNEEAAKLAKTKSEIDENKAQAEKARKDAESNRIRAVAYGDNLKAKTAAFTKAMETPALNFDELPSRMKHLKVEGGYVSQVSWDDIPEGTRKDLGIDPITTGNGTNRYVNIIPTNVLTKDGAVLTEQQVNEAYEQAVKGGYNGSPIQYLEKARADQRISGWDYELVGREPGKLATTRANRLTTTQNTAGRTKSKDLRLGDDGDAMPVEND
jgi:hypothetical protein